MKKMLYMVLAGTCVFGSLTAVSYAATSGLIGKKVQGVMSVSVNGKSVKDAVIIDGVTYAPIRSFSEAAGYNLDLQGGSVKLTAEEEQLVSELKIKDRIQTLQYNIKTYQVGIDTDQEIIKQAQATIDNLSALSKEEDVPQIDLSAATKKVDDATAEIADLQQKIDVANAEIAELQAQLNK